MSSATKPVGEAQPTITCRALHNFSPSLPYTVASYPCTTDPNAGGYSPGCGSAAVEFWPTSPGCCWAGARSHRTVKDKASWMTGDWDCIDWRQNYHKQKKTPHWSCFLYMAMGTNVKYDEKSQPFLGTLLSWLCHVLSYTDHCSCIVFQTDRRINEFSIEYKDI